MPKHGKGKGPHAAKAPRVTKERVTRSSSDENYPQHTGRHESKCSQSSSVIGREEVALVVEEVLKTLEQRDAASSAQNRSSSALPQGTTSAPMAMSSRTQDIRDLHLPGRLFV